MALLELVRHEPDWLAALEVAFTLPPGTPERRGEEKALDGEPPAGEEEPRRISDELLWLRHAVEEPSTSGLTPLPESAAVGMWDAEDACLRRLCRLRDRKILDAAGFLLHDAEGTDALLDAES
jgi:hypothetical protein